MVRGTGVEPVRLAPIAFKTISFTNLDTLAVKPTLEQLQNAISTSQSMREAASKLPINFKTFKSYAVKAGLYATNQRGLGISRDRPSYSLSDILLGKHPTYSSDKLKKRLIKEFGWDHSCHECLLSTWNNQPIPLELEHVDGNSYNHLNSNLRFLCPNCHAQTATYRNKVRPQINPGSCPG
jgi:hypothetical protein